MGFFDNFSFENAGRNVGGVRGGLLGIGEALGVMAESMGSGDPRRSGMEKWGVALGRGSRTMQRAFGVQKEKQDDRDFERTARERAELLPEGSRERQFWEAVGTPSRRDDALLPSLWNAQNQDARIKASKGGGGPTPPQYAKNRRIEEARKLIDRIHAEGPDIGKQIMRRMGVENMPQLITLAGTHYTNEPDPRHAYYFRKASESPLIGLSGLDSFTDPSGATKPPPPASEDQADSGGLIQGVVQGVVQGAQDAAHGVKNFLGFGDNEESDAAAPPTPSFESLIDGALNQSAAPSETPPPLSLPAQPQPVFGSEKREKPARPGRDLESRTRALRRQAQIAQGQGGVVSAIAEAERILAAKDRQRTTPYPRAPVVEEPDIFSQIGDAISNLQSHAPEVDAYGAGRKARAAIGRSLFGN